MKWLATLLLTPVVGLAQVLVSPNQGGGEITLTTRPCVYQNKTYDQWFAAYAWTNEIGKLDGCWTITDNNVHLLYFGTGQVRVYPLSAFTRRN